MVHFLRTKHPLLNQKGQLTEAGYSTSLILDYDRRNIKANALRIKEWDYYLITDGKTGLALTIADNSYMGLASISLLDFENRWEITKSLMRPFPMGKTNFPSSSEYGDLRISRKNYELIFENHGNNRLLTFFMDHFRGNETLRGEITLNCPQTESMVIATPFPQKPKAFYYNQKINCMPASGSVSLGGDSYHFSQDFAMGVLDWGRGVWPYKSTWFWSSASGRINGIPFGLNLGYGFGDTSAATENMLFYNGKAHKLDQVVFEIPQKENAPDYQRAWQIRDQAERLQLSFHPLLNRAAKIDFKLLCSDQQQVFGHFNGNVILDDGTKLTLKDFFGFVEHVKNKW